MTTTAEVETTPTTSEKESTDVLSLLSQRYAELLERVNAQSVLVQELHGSVADNWRIGSELERAQYELYLQDCQIAELKQSVEDLMAGSAVTVDRTVNTAPVITDRFKHSKTAKGWRLDESSLTIDWKGGTPNSETRARLLREAYADGLQEEKIRNEEPETLAIS